MSFFILFLGVAGGLTKLSKIPACNVLVLGSQKTTLSGFSQVATLPHTGFIYYSDIVQDTPPVRSFFYNKKRYNVNPKKYCNINLMISCRICGEKQQDW